MSEPRPPAYASIPEAAAYTRLSARTLRRAMRRGELQHHRIGRRVVLSYADLDRFIGRAPAGSAAAAAAGAADPKE